MISVRPSWLIVGLPPPPPKGVLTLYIRLKRQPSSKRRLGRRLGGIVVNVDAVLQPRTMQGGKI
jgi:hypothetical protein